MQSTKAKISISAHDAGARQLGVPTPIEGVYDWDEYTFPMFRFLVHAMLADASEAYAIDVTITFDPPLRHCQPEPITLLSSSPRHARQCFDAHLRAIDVDKYKRMVEDAARGVMKDDCLALTRILMGAEEPCR